MELSIVILICISILAMMYPNEKRKDTSENFDAGCYIKNDLGEWVEYKNLD